MSYKYQVNANKHARLRMYKNVYVFRGVEARFFRRPFLFNTLCINLLFMHSVNHWQSIICHCYIVARSHAFFGSGALSAENETKNCVSVRTLNRACSSCVRGHHLRGAAEHCNAWYHVPNHRLVGRRQSESFGCNIMQSRCERNTCHLAELFTSSSFALSLFISIYPPPPLCSRRRSVCVPRRAMPSRYESLTEKYDQRNAHTCAYIRNLFNFKWRPVARRGQRENVRVCSAYFGK